MKLTIKLLIVAALIAVNVWLWPTLLKMASPPQSTASDIKVESTIDKAIGAAEVAKEVEEVEEESLEEVVSNVEPVVEEVEESTVEKAVESDKQQTADIEIMEMNEAFLLLYKGKGITIDMNRESIEAIIGEPMSIEQVPGIYFDTVNYLYEDITFAFVPQTGDLTSVYFEQTLEVLDSAWIEELTGENFSCDTDVITSGDERTVFKLDVGESVFVSLFEDWEGPAFNHISETDEALETQVSPVDEGDGKKRRGDTFEFNLGNMSNGNNYAIAVFSSTAISTMYSRLVVGIDGEGEEIIKELEEPQFAPFTPFSHHLSLSVVPAYIGGISMMPGEAVSFTVQGKISPNAPLGTYRFRVRLEGTNINSATGQAIGSSFILKEVTGTIEVVE